MGPQTKSINLCLCSTIQYTIRIQFERMHSLRDLRIQTWCSFCYDKNAASDLATLYPAIIRHELIREIIRTSFLNFIGVFYHKHTSFHHYLPTLLLDSFFVFFLHHCHFTRILYSLKELIFFTNILSISTIRPHL